MSNYSKYNIIYRLQKWMDSVPGQTFLNYGYSWGASVVIAGALFKLTHLAGANIMLFLGMGTEVIVFFLSAFDRPFDKTDDGRELPTHVYNDDEEEEHNNQLGASYNGIEQEYNGNEAESNNGNESVSDGAEAGSNHNGHVVHGGQVVYGPTYVGSAAGQPVAGTAYQSSSDAAAAAQGATNGGQQPIQGGSHVAAPTAEQVAAAIISQQGSSLGQTQQNTPEMVEAQTSYVDALKNLTDMLSKVSEQSERLTRDSEEMENLNRTLTSISKVYEMQLKGASQQIGTIDQINEQTRKMAEQINQLNKIYARMIEAMTVNMRVAAPGATTPTED